MSGKNFIIISSIDWSTHWQMHHQLATSLVEAGNRVLFIENTGVRTPKLKDIGRIRDRICYRLQSEHGFCQINENQWVYSPLFIPLPYSKIANALNVLLISASISRWMRLLRFSDPVVISFLPTPLTQKLIESINPILSVYYCANHMAGSSASTLKLRAWEDKFFATADLIFTISEAISERAKPFAHFVYSFPAGVDIEKFSSSDSYQSAPVDMASLQRPIIGYVGALSDVFDQQQIIELAKALVNATILLVGPRYTNLSALEGIPNIVLLGERPHDQIPAYINSFDVALIPYVVNDFTDSVYSCKLNEYLAMGKPVVSSNTREVRAFSGRFPDTVLIGSDVPDFIAKVKQALDDPVLLSDVAAQKRIRVARENTWDKRFAGIMEVIERHLSLKLQTPVSWKDGLTRYYKSSRTLLAITTAIFLALYLLIFHTPLVWFLGEQLVVRHVPRRTDAIVVFSGNGETSYRNDSYQRRALDAVRFYKQGYAPHIILSSGKEQNLSEVTIIQLYLLDKGVPKSAIHILHSYPKSTYENVKMVHHELKQQGMHSILFVTSPYHGRRAFWTWRKQAPDIALWMPNVVDTPPAHPLWSTKVDKIRVIAYEYTAIVYNWLRGWL